MNVERRVASRAKVRRPARLVGGALAAAVVALTLGLAAASAAKRANVGQPPPEWAANVGSWPSHDYDLANTRSTTQTSISSTDVARLKVKWTFPLKGASAFGIFASAPIVLGGTVYFQDLASNVYALHESDGSLEWEHTFNDPNNGPDGIAYGWGRIFGATSTSAFALDPKTGAVLWTRRLVRNGREGIDMAPQLFDNTVLVSTVPGNVNSFYAGNGDGVVWALDAATGTPKWTFNTVSDGARLWGNPRLNSGGGLWYPPAVDGDGRVFLDVANPAPLYGSAKYPNASSRPGPNLYTDALVVLDGSSGKLLWYRQVVPHDIRDYDLMIPPILTSVSIGGAQTEIVIAAGKMGKAYAFRADNGKPLWTITVGRHQNDSGPLPRKAVTIYPGDLGGIETPMALSQGRLFIPWLDFGTLASSTGLPNGLLGSIKGIRTGRGGIAAFDAATGRTLWSDPLPSIDFGAATVANDVVFTSTFDGSIYALDTSNGKTLWTAKAPAGINSFPAVAGDTLIVGAGTTGFDKNPKFELIAYSLS